MMQFLVAFLATAALSAIFTPLVRRLAVNYGALDHPDAGQPGARRIHTEPIARLGGVAMYAAFALVLPIFFPHTRVTLALILGITLLVSAGVVDDIRGLSPWTKLAIQIMAAVVVLSGGIGITNITNPFGGVLELSWGRFSVELLGQVFHVTPVANLLSIFWMVGVVNAINFLDGLDGLAGGVSGIAALVMFALSLSSRVNQPDTAMLAIILVGAVIGFLPYNFSPAKIFMGDSGSYFLGIVLALIAMYSGAKLATAALVLGVPIIDSMWAVIRRVYRGQSPFKADREHLHHLLLARGFSQRQAVLIFYAFAVVFGGVALYVHGLAKLFVMAILVLSVAFLTRHLSHFARRA